jgi:hypothetical protein
MIRVLALALLVLGAGGFVMQRGHPVPVTISNTDNSSSPTDTASPSYATQDIGTENGNRKVVVGAYCDDDGSASPDVTALTVGGISATEVVELNQAAQSTSIWSVVVPTGTTATIAFTSSVTCERTSIGVWAVYYSKFAAGYASGTGVNVDLTITLDEATIPPGSVGVMYYTNANATAGQADTAVSFSGTTERWDFGIESNAARHAGADATFNPPTSAAPTFSMTNPSSGRAVMAVFW